MKKTTTAVADNPGFTASPADQAYLAGITNETKRFCSTLAPSPSCGLPILTAKVQALIALVEALHRIPAEEGKPYRRAVKAVGKAETALYGTVDHLRAAAREFGWYDAQRGVTPAAVAPLDPSGSSDPIIHSIHTLSDGMASA